VRRGLAPAAASLWAETAREASATIPAAVIKHTARFVTSSPAAGAVPVAVTALAEGVIQMMWLARLKPLVAVAAALILASVGVAVQGRQQPAPEGAREQASTARPPTVGAGRAALAVPDPEEANRAIARQQLVLIDEAWAYMRSLYENARIEYLSFAPWGRRRLDALHRAGAGKAEIVAALEKHINDLKELEAIAKARKEAARSTELGVFEFQFLHMEAEIWLNEEKAR
jgi:hypothetical protein